MPEKTPTSPKTPFVKTLLLIKNSVFLAIGIAYFYYMGLTQQSPLKLFLETHLNETILTILSGCVFFLFLLGFFGILITILQKVMDTVIKKSKTKIDDLIGVATIKFLQNIEYVVSIYIPLYFIGFKDKIVEYIDMGFLVLIIIFAIIFINRLGIIFYDSMVLKNRKFKFLNKSLAVFMKKALIVIIW